MAPPTPSASFPVNVLLTRVTDPPSLKSKCAEAATRCRPTFAAVRTCVPPANSVRFYHRANDECQCVCGKRSDCGHSRNGSLKRAVVRDRAGGRPDTHDVNKTDPGDEAADVRPERHAALLAGQSGQPAEDLQQEPVAEHHPGRHPDGADDDAEKDQSHHAGARIAHRICPEHAADRTRRADHWDRAAWVCHRLRRCRGEATQHVEYGVADAAE